ncbi:hypothetical protein GCM10020229_00300 [Kitasatospora albolonga]|uniref:hypothetical protein n=1 Tax=Kitasatospora albolonga TaxID=68173 RepID=UPI0031F00C06
MSWRNAFGRGPVRVLSHHQRHADLEFSGDLGGFESSARISEVLRTLSARGVNSWTWDLSRVTHLGSENAVKFLGPFLLQPPDAVTVTVRGASPQVRKTLRQIGAGRLLHFED